MSMDRSLRPLMARPLCSNGCTFCTTSSPTQYCSSLHNPRLTSWTQQPSSDYGGGSKREMKSLVSSRWNPTPEQVQALEDMFRRGTRTPSAEQIQQIAARLRRFGKIEGKNVFYWFQNHKARDRQKKRRQLDLLPGKKHISTKNAPNQPAGLSRKHLEIEHAKKLPRMSKCGTASKYLGGEVDECKRDGWTQLDLSSCMPPSVSMHKTSGQENAHPFVALKMLTPKTDDFEENRTLELFPVRSSGCSTKDKELNVDASSAETKLVPNQFFEFLPSKN